jgi:hypothetical protein
MIATEQNYLSPISRGEDRMLSTRQAHCGEIYDGLPKWDIPSARHSDGFLLGNNCGEEHPLHAFCIS